MHLEVLMAYLGIATSVLMIIAFGLMAWMVIKVVEEHKRTRREEARFRQSMKLRDWDK